MQTSVQPTVERLVPVLHGCVANLVDSWNPPLALFPFSSRSSGTGIVHDWTHPIAVRYTINSLLGLAAAADAGLGIEPEHVAELTRAFLARHRRNLPDVADRGLLALLLAGLDEERRGLNEVVRGLETLVRERGTSLNMQDLAWTVWGCAAAVEVGVAAAERPATAALDLMLNDFVDPASGLPRHSTQRYRRNVVSFGSLTYYLRALHEAATSLGHDVAERRFAQGVERAIALQGPRGEWPWMIHVRRALAFDPYPVFAVHQDAMALLWLLPALDAGLRGAEQAIERSVAWVFGANELETPMYRYEPFFACRSIERTERLPRFRRYVRSRTRHAADFGAARTRVNDQCRSYHLGWILYAWAGRRELLAVA